MPAKHMYVCVSQNMHDSPSWKLSKLSSWESTNVFKKEKKIVSLFFVKAKKRKGKKAFRVEAAADLASNNQGSFYNQEEWLQEIDKRDISGQ